MKLEFSRQGLIEALIHLLIMAAAAMLNEETPQMWSDSPAMAVQDLA